MILGMLVRRVPLAFACSVFIAAFVANSGTSLAATSSAASLSADAYQALVSGDANRSVSLFTQSIESRDLGGDALANALLNRALAYQNLGRDNEAIEDYTAALNLDAMNSNLRARALFNRGLSQQKVKAPTLAIEDFTSSLLIDPTFAQAYLARANALRDSGQFLFAISDYERALKYNHPQTAWVLYGESQAYEALRRPLEAKKLLQQALKVDGNFAPAAARLKVLGDVAEVDDMSGDMIETGSVTTPLSSTDVVAQNLPKGVEPPPNLAGQSAEDGSADDTAVDASASANVDMTPLMQPNSDAKVIVDSVPTIPQPPHAAPAPVAPVVAVVKPAAAPVMKKPVQVASNTAAAISDDSDPVAASPAAPVMEGWVVQVSSATSEDAAWSTWKSMQKKFKSLAAQKPAVVKADLGTKGIFFRVRLGGYDDQLTAQRQCMKLKADGVACFVTKA